MHVIFVEPGFPKNQREFVRALHRVGVRVTGIGERPIDALDDDLKGWLHRYEQVKSVVDEHALFHAVRRCQAREWVDRMEATIEAHVMAAARVREACSIPGTSVQTTFLCRDKPSMKEALRAAGVPCAESTGASTSDELREFVARVGFPVILKPRDAAGAAGTGRVDDWAQLDGAIGSWGLDRGGSVAVEEYVEGHEGVYDTICRDGEVIHEFIGHYFPNVLEAMRERWISATYVTTNRVASPGYDELRAMGAKVIRSLGIGTSATHMEWFFGPKGLKFSEIGCRPAGVLTWDLYSIANEMDVYAEWARAIVGQPIAERPSRRFNGGMVSLRPDRDGRISGYRGLEEAQRRYGEWILDAHLPPVGTPTQPIEAGFMANAWVRLRHPDYDEMREMLGWIGSNVKVFAS